jgi:hypothetical protein
MAAAAAGGCLGVWTERGSRRCPGSFSCSALWDNIRHGVIGIEIFLPGLFLICSV